MSEVIKVCDSLSINFPWVPDMIQAYKFGTCILCKAEKEKNNKFDSKDCPHCEKETKKMCWVARK
jgi:hypothetical protein